MKKILFTILTVTAIGAAGMPALEAAVLSFRNIIAAGGTGVDFTYDMNTVTATGSRIYGNGYSDISELPGGHGTGFANNYNGILFEDAGDVALPANTTQLEGHINQVADGNSSDMAKFVGFHIHFSAPVPVFDFYMTDIDSRELGFSFALNGTAALTPSVIRGGTTWMVLDDDHALDTTAMNTAIATSDFAGDVAPGAVLPTALDLPHSTHGGNLTGNDPEGQVRFSYGGAEATDLFFAWGYYDASTSTGTQRSGLSGLSVVESTVVIPEPSRALLAVVGLAAVGLRRRRS